LAAAAGLPDEPLLDPLVDDPEDDDPLVDEPDDDEPESLDLVAVVPDSLAAALPESVDGDAPASDFSPAFAVAAAPDRESVR
jgi:hypothetical protein